MGSGGGILGGVTSFLFGKPTSYKAPEVKVAAPAPPAPATNTDTGAIIQKGSVDKTVNSRYVPFGAGSSEASARTSTLGNLRANNNW